MYKKTYETKQRIDKDYVCQYLPIKKENYDFFKKYNAQYTNIIKVLGFHIKKSI